MFWGLIMEPGRCYTQTVKVAFHVSMAALDVSNSNDQPVQVMCVFEGRNYLLCTLNNKDKVQCPLDLNFEAGTKLSFATNGKSHVHLTGYLTALDDDEFGEEEEDDVEEEEQQKLSKKQKKRLKEIADGPPIKKSKTEKKVELSQEGEEEESDDSDYDINALMEEDSDDDNEEESEVASDDLDEEEEEAEDEEDEDEEASSLSEDEETVAAEKPKQNGVSKKSLTPSKQQKNDAEKPSKKEKLKNKEKEKQPKKEEKPQQQLQQKTPKGKKQTLKGGVIAEDLKEGSGDIVKPGKFVHVYYEGRLKDNNKLFDSTTKGPGFSFLVGKGEVIKGWDVGIVGMKVGGKRRITCPANVAYGAKGSPPVIPPNATLVFDIELKKVN